MKLINKKALCDRLINFKEDKILMDENIENVSASKLNMKAVNCSILEGENLEISIRHFDPKDCTKVQYSIFKIDDDYTDWYSTSDSSISREENIIKFSCNLNSQLQKGFYVLRQLSFFKPATEANAYRTPTSVHNLDLVLFEIRAAGETPHTPQELSVKFEEIIRKREEEFLSGFGNSLNKQGMKEYRGFVFVKDCLLTRPMRLDRYNIFPLGYLPFTDEVNKILSSLNEVNINISFDEMTMNRCQNVQPVFVAHFPKIIAPSVEEAAKLIRQEVKSLSDLLSIHRSSYGSIFGLIIIDSAEGKFHSIIPIPSYRGNLVGGMISGEVPKQIKQRMNKIRKSPQLQLYLSLYNDIQYEERSDFVIFRCWNLLETTARSKNYVGQPLLDINGNPTLNSKGKPIIIEDKAVSLVTELIRQAYLSFNSKNLANILQNGSIDIWYRHRNCTGHKGGCFPSDPNYCDRNNDKYKNCKQDHDNGDVKLNSIFYALKEVINNELR